MEPGTKPYQSAIFFINCGNIGRNDTAIDFFEIEAILK